MELHKSLQYVIQTDGAEILNQSRLINILDDLHAYQDIPAAKYILRSIVTDGYMTQFLSIGNWNNQTEALVHKFSKSTGFVLEVVNVIFQSIAYGLNWIEKISNIPLKQENDASIKGPSQSSAKEAPKHICFKGIPITGSKEEFLKSIEKIGMFRSTKNWDNFALFFGSFAEIDDCEFRVEFSPFNGQAYEVQVWMPTQDSWVECKSRYLDFKTRLISKYGEPDSCFEFFEFPYGDAEGKGNELSLLRNDKIIYKSLFRIDNGAIELKIHHYGDVHITYEDKVNADYHYAKADEVLNSDL